MWSSTLHTKFDPFLRTNPKQDYSGKITSIGSRGRKRSVNITAFLMLPNKCMGSHGMRNEIQTTAWSSKES